MWVSKELQKSADFSAIIETELNVHASSFPVGVQTN